MKKALVLVDGLVNLITIRSEGELIILNTEVSVPTEQDLNGVIKIDASQIHAHLGSIVRESLEETLNKLLDDEADRLCNAQRYEHTDERTDIVGTYNQATSTRELYVDGIRVNFNNNDVGPLPPSDAPLRFGMYEFTLWDNGSVDEVAIWNRVLSSTEIAALYNSGAGVTISDWRGVSPSPIDTAHAISASVIVHPLALMFESRPQGNLLYQLQ